MSVNQFNTFFEKAQETTPVTISGLPYIDDGLYGVQESAAGSSRSSVYSSSKSTVIEVKPPQSVPRPSSSPPLPPPPPHSSTAPAPAPSTVKPTPPPPPPKPTQRPIPPPPPLPASPPPRAPASEPPSVGIPLYSEKHQQRSRPPPQTAFVAAPPRPPSFAPPVPPADLITDITATNALTNAMFEQLKHTSAQYDYATYGSERAYPVQMRNPKPVSEPAAGLGNRRHSVPDDIRHYADERTPPPVLHDVVDRYSTVAYMNQEPNQYTTRIGSHSPNRGYVGVRDAHRLSREDLRVVDAHSSPSDSQSEELRRMYSGRSGNSVKPTGDITARYVYDTANRNYTSYGERQQQARQSYVSTTTTDRKRWSRSSEPRSETYINDPFYPGKETGVTGYGVIETRRSRTSLHSHGGSVPELIHSENKYDYQQVNDQRTIERQSRQDAERRSRRQSTGSRQIYIDRQISPERQRKDLYSGSVNMQDNPQYNIPRREVPPPPIPPKTQNPPVHRINGGEVYEDERTLYEAYSQIHHQRPPPPPSHIGQGVQPQPQQYPPRYDAVPDPSQSNHYIIPKSMRGSGSPIQQHYDTYGEPLYVQRNIPLGMTEETTTTTTTTRKEEIERKRKKKEEENRRKKREEEERKRNSQNRNGGGQIGYDAYSGNGGGGSQVDYGRYDNRGVRDAEDGLIEEEYNTRHMKRTIEHPQRKYQKSGEQVFVEDGYGQTHGRTDQRDGHGSSSRKVVETTRRQNLGWSPRNYRNPRDCFLNLLCFVIAPLVIILIIVVIIVFVIIQ